VTYGVGFVPRVEHNDSAALVFIDHAPQINDGVWQRHLSHYVCVACTVTLHTTHMDHAPQINDGVWQRHLSHYVCVACTVTLHTTHTCADNYYYYFTSAAVAVDSSHMTASLSTSWSRFSPPSSFVNGHVSTMWFMVHRWPQSQEGDWARPHLCKLARHGP